MSIAEVSVSSECKCCGSEGRLLFSNLNKHGSVSQIHSYLCPSCGMVFVGNLLSHEELGEAYGTLNGPAYFERIREVNRRKMARCAGKLVGLLSRNSDILDLGCGDGEFIRVLREFGFHSVSGQEIPGTEMPRLPEGTQVYLDYDYETIPDESFDCVTMLDVAEHVPDPKHLFASCLRILRPGGLLYLHTPGVSFLDKKMHRFGKVGMVWQRSRTSIFHLQNYSQDSMRRFLGGFTDVSIRQVNELSGPLSRYVEAYLKPPKALVPLVSLALWPILCTPLNRNKLVVIARKERS